MIKLETIQNAVAYRTWGFKTEADFIAFTIEHAKIQNQTGDECEALTSYGFVEVIDKQILDEDGDIVEFESHWEATYPDCLKFWKKHANQYLAGQHWKVTKENQI